MSHGTNGTDGTNGTYDQLPLHQINLINPNRFAIAIECDNDAETNRSLRGGHHDDKHREYLTSERVPSARVLQVARKGNEIQVRRVQDQLNRHEDYEQIAAR